MWHPEFDFSILVFENFKIISVFRKDFDFQCKHNAKLASQCVTQVS